MKPIWYGGKATLPLGPARDGTLADHLGIEIIEIGPDFIKGTLPVDHRTRQSAGLLHGGANVALAETLMSVGAASCVDRVREQVVGLDINASHLRAVRNGKVIGTARPVRIGRTTQVWEARIETEGGDAVCVARMTLAVLQRDRGGGAR